MHLTGTCSRCGRPHKYDPKTGKMIGACVSGQTRRGAEAEAMLAAQLTAAGFYDTTHKERPNGIPSTWCFRREHPWGLALVPERGFTADVAFLGQRLLCEVKGLAHAAGRKKVKSDVEREGLAVSLGWRVLPLTPESVRDGTAVALIAAALAARKEG